MFRIGFKFSFSTRGGFGHRRFYIPQPEYTGLESFDELKKKFGYDKFIKESVKSFEEYKQDKQDEHNLVHSYEGYCNSEFVKWISRKFQL